MGGEKRRLQRLGAVCRQAGGRRERPRHGQERRFAELDELARHHVFQAVDTGDTVAHRNHGACF